MNTPTVRNTFKTNFLSSFVFSSDTLPFRDDEISHYDLELSQFEQVYLNPDIEKNLISKNELLASYAISKAELSSLTLQEAKDVYAIVISNTDYDFVSDKLKTGERLTQKDYDKVEFFNIARLFRNVSRRSISFEELDSQHILRLHKELTQGLDIFDSYLPDFTVYKSGQWRTIDTIRVGEYLPAPYKEIEEGVEELVHWIKNNRTITGVAIFHTALYAIHPFSNGNKRVCRILEHMLLRQLGINQKNLYSTSYYYHKQKPRYYKNLMYSLERKNLNHFVSFVQEAIMLSMVSVIKTSLEAKRNEYLNMQTNDPTIKSILRPLIKKKEQQFKHLIKNVHKKMARQTFATNLQKAADQKIVTKKEIGRSTYYSLNIWYPEEDTIKSWISLIKNRLHFVPDDFMLL